MAKASDIRAGAPVVIKRRLNTPELLLLAALSLGIGFFVGSNYRQSANSLVEAGYTITDPEGYSVHSFEDGFHYDF